MRPRPTLSGLLLCAAMFGCGGEDKPTQTEFKCNASAVPTATPLKRLSALQLRTTLADLVELLDKGDAAAITTELGDALSSLPTDALSGPEPSFGGQRRLDQTLYQQTTDGMYSVGAALGAAITAGTGSARPRLTAAAGACATDANTANDATCLTAFVRTFGARVLRHPLSDADVAFYVGVAGTTIEPEDYGDIITVLLSSPSFLYLVEQGDPDSTANPRPLTGYELAARLSYHFWQTMPDTELAAAAESGELLTEAGYKAQVERLSSDPRTDRAIDELYGEWLEPTHLGQLDIDKDDPAFKTFAQGFVPTADLRDHMTAELTSMARYYTQTDGSFEDFFRSDRSFAEHDDVASLYRVPAWHDGAPPTFADPGREGVLARAALTATGFVTSRPIIKGVYVRRTILCDTIPDPPADAMSVAQQIDTTHLTTSRDFAQAVSGARSDCGACHNTIINPLGFPTENYDGLGRVRTHEWKYDPTTGAKLGDGVAVDTTATPRILLSSKSAEPTEVHNVAEFNQALLATGKPQACFARHYFRFTFGRTEDLANNTDDCALAELQTKLLDGEGLGAVMRSVALRPEFKTRTFD